VVAALEAEEDGGRRGAAAAERDAVLRALERGEASFERGAGRVAGARVVIVLVAAGAVLRERARENDRRHDRAVDRIGLLTRVDAKRFLAKPFVVHRCRLAHLACHRLKP